MHPGTFRALEFDRVIEALVRLAATPMARARLAGLEPSADPRRVEALLAATSEGVRLLAEHPSFPLRAPDDVEITLQTLAFEGRPLEPTRLLGFADYLDSVDEARAVVRKVPRQGFPALWTLTDALASFDREREEIRRAIDPSGEVVDAASPELKQVRERIRRLRSRLRGTFESYVRGRETARYLQDLVVTDRNGRYVLVVRAEHRNAIPGIVHGSSSSGASLYLEPLSTVELNNEVVALQEQEAEEVRRILLALTDAFRERAIDLRRTVDAATDLDVIQAKARFATRCRAVTPVLSHDGRLELRGARHPLLIPAVVGRTQTDAGDRVPRERDPVPVDVLIVPPTRVLVITGPNTGGKTVALKTAGLLALMAQAGLHVPAEAGSSVPVFQAIFADIGDEQSIAANLSTFSWHVTNIAGMDRRMRLPALVLLDEVGAGTDPLEGGALGMAIVDHFRERGALVVATTHSDTLKSYASTTPQVTAAGFGFDPETFAPTYKLMYGSPGTSLALEIAGRLGLPASIVAAARSYRSARETQLADHLAKIDRDLHALDHERRLVARERERLAEIEAQYRAREESLRGREEQFRRRLDDAVQERMREARREIDGVVDEVRRKAAALAEEATRRTQAAPRLVGAGISTGDTGGLKASARAALEEVSDRLRRAEEVPAVATAVQEHVSAGAGPVEVGVRVRVGALGLEGIVESVHATTADVSVNGKRLRASLSELQVLGRAGDVPGRVTVHVSAQAGEGTLSDLNVIGCTVAEAIDRTDKFLDRALVGEQRLVRVIHGHGTGQLRRALGEYLSAHPLVSRVASAPPDQGGGGVTVVELKD